MKKLNSEALFDIFSQGDEQVYHENGVHEILDNSFVLLGMVVKGVENFFIIDQMYHNRYGKQYESVRDNLQTTYFTNLVKYLSRIDVSHSDTLRTLEDEFTSQAIHYALDQLLQLCEEKEQYEHCATIFKISKIFSTTAVV